MARVFLVNPPSSEPVRSPLLSLCYLVAALERAGHTAAVLDASASHGPRDLDQIAEQVRAFAPDLVGLHIKTLHALDAYALARRLHGLAPLVAGGPHPTVAPTEPLEHGFGFSALGEGEEVLCELADAIDGKRSLGDVHGLAFRDGGGAIRLNPRRGFLLDLDALASPIPSLRHFDPGWYGATRPVPFAGILSSRGCPAACTFCSNNVTGRRFRYRRADLIADEVRQLRDEYGASAFAFFDDSFAVGHRRVVELSDALAAIGGVSWSCTAHPAHLDPPTIEAMKRGGCGGVDIGMESGDPLRLVTIGKGVTRERVRDVVAWCRAANLHVVVNLMFGWPGETIAEIEATVDFLHEAAALGAMFNARGVLVPYPGTAIYDDNHRRCGFTDWWLREPLVYEPFPAQWDRAEIERAYASDAALARNFFRHDDRVLAKIEAALQLKARVTYDKLLGPAVNSPGAVPAAGAR